MFNSLSKNLLEKQFKNTLSYALRYRFMDYRNENIIGGGLEKPQGGLKEEKYFSEQNNSLMSKIRDNGAQFKKVNSDEKFNLEFSNTCNGRHSALRNSCFINKQKNSLEEAFFLNEQNECCAKLGKQEIKNPGKTDIEQRSPYSSS